MPSLQTKALVVTPISGDNFRTQLYGWLGMYAPIKLNFPFCEENRFLVFF